MNKSLVAAMTLMALAFAVTPAFAQDNAPVPPFVTTTDAGWTTIDVSQLVETGTVEMAPPPGYPYSQFTIPGTDIPACVGCMTYNTYTDASGEYTIIVPDPYTATVLAATQTGPFAQEPVYVQASDGLTASMLLTGGFENMGITNEEAISGYFDTITNVWTLSEGEGTQTSLVSDPFVLIRLMAANAQSNGPNDFVLGSGYFVYPTTSNNECLGSNCSASLIRRPPFRPGRTRPQAQATLAAPTAVPTLSVNQTYIPVDCPLDPSVAQADPATAIQARKISPNYPVVVGQDPAKTGVTFSLSMTVPQVFYSYNVKNTHQRCEGAGCGQPPGAGPVTIVTYETCDRVTDTYPDNLAAINISANLAPESREWITTELAVKYPGASIYQADWNVFPGACPASLGGPSFYVQCNAMQFRDPGGYILNAIGVTTGTPVSPPRSFSYSQRLFDVALMEVALIK